MEKAELSVMRSGNLNPMFGKKHDNETKKKISNSQKARYAAIRKALNEDNILNYGKDDLEARREVLLHLLDKNTLTFRTLQQAANFFAIMLDEEKVKRIVQEQIDKFVRGCKPTYKQRF